MARTPKVKLKPADALIDAAFLLASREGWQNITMEEIGLEANLKLAGVLSEFPTKNKLLDAFSRKIDCAVLARVTFDIGEDTPRDRLFELIMCRFDVLTHYKKGLYAVFIGSCSDPISVYLSFNRMLTSSRLILEAAGINSVGCKGEITARVLALIYANALKVWLNDETPDLASTMVALDRGLMRAEYIMTLANIREKDKYL